MNTIEVNQVINRYNDYLDCNYCNNEIEINDSYFIVYHDNENTTEYIICSNECKNDAIDFLQQ